MSKTQFLHTVRGIHSIEVLKLTNELSPGCYTLHYDDRRQTLYYLPLEMKYDKIVDLPSKEFTTVMNEMNHFLKPETKQSYVDHGFLYKRSIFLHGLPGTGKTCIVNRVSEAVVKADGIVILCDNSFVVQMALKELEAVNPNVLTLVLFEEFDEMLDNGHENNLLKLLDGQVQKNNCIYLATTNFLNKIPKRILRPGRFSRLIEVGFPSLEARTKYINIVSKKQDIVAELAEKSEGFSIDELKECVLSVNCLNYTIDETVKRVKATKEITTQLKNNTNEDDVELDFEDEPDYNGSLKTLPVGMLLTKLGDGN